MNLAENLDRTARARGRFAALVLGDEVTSFGEVERWSRRVAGFLAGSGVRTGDRVGLVLADVLEFAALYYGILRLGAVVVPVSPHLSPRGVRHLLADSGARGVVVGAQGRASVAPAARALGIDTWLLETGGLADLVGDATERDQIVPRGADDVAVIVYTAGVTGESRGATLTHGNLLRNCEFVVNDLLQLTSEDVVLGGFPLSSSFGQTTGLNAAVRAGACLVLLDRLDPEEALAALHGHAVTVLEATPEMYDGLLRRARHADHDLPRLRICVSGGAALPLEVLLGFEDAFHCVVLESYGLAETSPLASFNRADRRRVGSIGVPVNGVELRVVDGAGAEVEDGESGEIVVRGHNVMIRYWGRESETRAAVVDGWLHTGDLGAKDEDGYFYVVDRLGELIVRDGRTVCPREVEEVLRDHPAVVDAAVIGVPHPALGEEIHAVVTIRPGANPTPGGLRDFVKERVAAHALPREIDIVDALPRTSTGAILKREIRLETPA